MITGTRKLAKDLLSLGVFFIAMYSVVWVIALTMMGGGVGHEYLVLAIPLLLLYALRRIAGEGYAFFVLTIPIAIGCWYALGLLGFGGLAGFFMVASVIHSFIARVHGEIEVGFGVAVFCFALFALLLLVLPDVENVETYRTQVVSMYLLLLGFIILFRQMERLDYRMSLQRNLEGVALSPRKLMRTNSAMGFAFAVLVISFGFLTFFLPIHLVARFLAWLMARVGDFLGEIPDRGEIPMDLPIFDAEDDMAAMETDFIEDPHDVRGGELAWFFGVAIGVVVAICLIAAIVLAVRKLKAAKKKKRADIPHEAIKLGGSLLDDLLDLLPRFNRRHPIRRAYEKKVNSHIKLGIAVENYDTTVHIADKIRENEDIDELTERYEAVRYGRLA